MKFTRLLTASALLGLLITPAALANAQPVGTNTMHAMKGTTVPLIHSSKAQKLDRMPGSQVLDIVVGLKLRNQDALQQLLQDLYDPTSPRYQQWLTPDQFAAQFAPTQDQVDAVTAYLKGQGLTVHEVSKNNTLLQVSGSAANIEKAFNITLSLYTVNGARHFANDTELTVPDALAGTINSVIGLTDLEQMTGHAKLSPNKGGTSTPTATTPSGYSPAQINTAYNITPIHSAGVTGSGQTIAIATAYTFKQSDIDTFSSTYGIPSVTPTVVPVGRSSKKLDVETTLDLERSHAMAPGASIMMYETPDSYLTSFTTMFNQIATDNKAKSVSTSWGLSEVQTSTSTMDQDHQIFMQMAAQGQSMYAASGDDGATDGTTQMTLDYPSGDSYVVSTGGTTLNLSSSNTRSSETAWNGAGGGTSTYFAAPSWQAGTTAYTQNGFTNDGMRHAADISMDADPQTGYSVMYNGSWSVYGGTSFVAPEMNGFTALINNGRANNGKTSIGNMGLQIWNLGNSSSASTYFYDVTSGNNSGFNAGAGFDGPTGFGALNGSNIWNALK